ncbi:hypothetical protein C0993_001700 [Termitomyces sp. T159_Od127]|nr:hypothetical protein C0993_001700 [Termitomyces sp. T159_Od127]
MTTPFTEVISLILTLALILVITVPLTGVLVRLRANYNPKALRLDVEGSAQAHTGPVIHSYLGMMARVYRLEGTLVYTVGMMLISLPTAILTYRSITTPHKLSSFRLTHSLRILLTSTERRRPWVLYLTPGLLAAEVLHIVIIVLGLGPLRRLLVPELSPNSGKWLSDISAVKLSIYLVIVALSTAILTPLEVIATRLAIQRNHASSEYNSVSQEVDGDAEETTEFSGAEEDVIG